MHAQSLCGISWSMFRVRYLTVRRDGDCGSHRAPLQKLALHPLFQGLSLVNKIRLFLLNFFASPRCRLRDASRLWLFVLDSLGRVSGLDVWYTTACRETFEPLTKNTNTALWREKPLDLETLLSIALVVSYSAFFASSPSTSIGSFFRSWFPRFVFPSHVHVLMSKVYEDEGSKLALPRGANHIREFVSISCLNVSLLQNPY